MQEPVQLLAALPGINPCTFCFYVPKTISPFTPPHIWKPLRNTCHSQRRAETLIIPSRYRQRFVQPHTHGQECEHSHGLAQTAANCTPSLGESCICFWSWQKCCLDAICKGQRTVIVEPQNHSGWKKALRAPGPTPTHPAVPTDHIPVVPEHLHGRALPHLHGQLCQRTPTLLQSYPIAERAGRGWVGFLYCFFNNRIAGWLTYGIGQQNGEMLTSGGQKGRNGAVRKAKYFLL